jgi:hypothetical protein
MYAMRGSEPFQLLTEAQDTLVPPFELTLDRVGAFFADGDYEAALAAAEAMLSAIPLHVAARDWATKCRAALEVVYLANIGSLAKVGVLVATPHETRGFAMDHAAGFLLAQVDGATDVESLLDVSSMPRHAALRILSSFATRGIVTFR